MDVLPFCLLLGNFLLSLLTPSSTFFLSFSHHFWWSPIILSDEMCLDCLLISQTHGPQGCVYVCVFHNVCERDTKCVCVYVCVYLTTELGLPVATLGFLTVLVCVIVNVCVV